MRHELNDDWPKFATASEAARISSTDGFDLVGDITDVEAIAAGHRNPRFDTSSSLVWQGLLAEDETRRRGSGCVIGPFASLNCTGMKHMASAKKSSSARSTSIEHESRHRQHGSLSASGSDGYELARAEQDLHRATWMDAERDGDLRIIDESGEDYLFAADRFVRHRGPCGRASVSAEGRPSLNSDSVGFATPQIR